MSDPETRVGDALRGLPGPDDPATARARRAALGALAPPRAGERSRGGRRGAALALALAIAALATAGLALAGTGRLEVRFGPQAAERPQPPSPPPGRLAVPADLDGVALVAGSRLWMGTRAGFRIEGLAVSAAELSPNARFLAVGLGDALVAMAPDGRRVWTHPAGGTVVAAAWSPNPLPTSIVYVVRRGEGHELRLIEGNGRNDRLLDADAGPARPSWRSDLLAVAYAGGDGRARVHDFHSGRTLVPAACAGRVRALAFAPSGARLAFVGGPGGALLGVTGLGGARPADCARAGGSASRTGIAWLTDDDLVAAEGPAAGRDAPSRLVRYSTGPGGLAERGRASTLAARVLGVSAAQPGGALTVLAAGDRRTARRGGLGPGRLEVWRVLPPGGGGTAALNASAVVLRLGSAPEGPALSVR